MKLEIKLETRNINFQHGINLNLKYKNYSNIKSIKIQNQLKLNMEIYLKPEIST